MKRDFEKVYARLLCGCAALLAGVCATTASAANMLADPGFESQTSAPNPNPTGTPGWAFFNAAGFSNTIPTHSGTWAANEPAGAGNYSVPGAYQLFAATPGETFTLSGWVYTPNTLVANSNDFAILQLSWFTGAPPTNYGGGSANGTAGVNVGTPAGGGGVALPQGTWTFASVTATAPAGTNSMGAYLLDINADAAGTFYFDDLSLTVPEPTSLGMLGLVGMGALRRRRR
jgi:hypothetical protein